MAVIERTYNVPLRSEWLKTPKYRRAKKAVAAVRAYVEKHMKSDSVLIGPMLNLKIWEHGIKNPPHHVKVNAVKDEKGLVRVELVGFEFKEKVKKDTTKKPQAKGLAGKIQKKLEETKGEEEAPKEAAVTKKDLKKADAKAEPKPAEQPAEKKEEAKPEEKPAEAPAENK